VDQRDTGEFRDDRRKKERGREKEKKRDSLKIGGLSYCSIFECFVELSFNVAKKKPFQSSSGCQEQKEYGTSVTSNVQSEK